MFNSYPTEKECLKNYDYCKIKKIEIDGQKLEVYIKKCPPNKMKLGFMCVPYCMSEMDQELLETLGSDPNYCVEDYVNLGLPFYDFN